MSDKQDNITQLSDVAKEPRRTKGKVTNKLGDKIFLIPSFITVLGFFLGFWAILNAFTGKYIAASLCILSGLVFDGLDGRVARKLNATSEFGKEFDSFSDLVTFGVAPALLVYCWAFKHIADQFGILISFLFVVCAATRLARFNIKDETQPSKRFTGLPTPGAAAGIAVVVYASPENIFNPSAVALCLAYTTLLSFLMVSHIPFLSVKRIKFDSGNQKRNLVLVSFVVALTWYQPAIMGVLITLCYLLSGPYYYLQDKKEGRHREVI